MTATRIKAKYVREPDDLGAIITVPRYELTGRLESVTVTFRQVFLTIDGFQHVVAPDERVEFDEITEARLAADGDRRFVILEARAIAAQSALFRTIRNWEAGR